MSAFTATFISAISSCSMAGRCSSTPSSSTTSSPRATSSMTSPSCWVFKELTQKTSGGRIDDGFARRGRSLQASCQVGRLADDRLLLGRARAEQVSNDKARPGPPAPMRARRLRIMARTTLALILIKPAKPKLRWIITKGLGHVKTTYLREDLTMTKPIDALKTIARYTRLRSRRRSLRPSTCST